MSAKYQRVKQADLLLPAPLRWLTRAFSSITLAVILLSLVCLYGAFASVPLPLLAKFGLWVGLFAFTVAPTTIVAVAILMKRYAWSRRGGAVRRGIAAAAIVVAGWAVFIPACFAAHDWFSATAWYRLHAAQVLYRFPAFEMTELEFYSWWPLQLVLALFVINMVWATIRRIEFRWLNIGVLSVHTGIVIIALGSLFYGYFKLEGDTIVWRTDLGGLPVAHFYDGTTPAVFLTVAGGEFQIPLPQLPRYNDYDPDRGELDIRLHDDPLFEETFGPNVRATIRGFISYGDMVPSWQQRDPADLPPSMHNPAVRIGVGDENGPFPIEGAQALLLAGVPAQRYVDFGLWSVELLLAPNRQRFADLTAEFDGAHGLIVEVPDAGVRQVHAIEPGKTLAVEGTPYTLHVEQIGPYELGFVTPGYEGASDTRALVRIEEGQTSFRRVVMNRFPERSQDFVPAPDDPHAGPMGRRTDPDPRIHLAYVDASRPSYHLIARAPAAANAAALSPDATDGLVLLARQPGHALTAAVLDGDRVPLGQVEGRPIYMHLLERVGHMARVLEPTPTPKSQRTPKDEGTYLHALLPIDFEVTRSDGSVFHHRMWLQHMRYPRLAVSDPSIRVAFEANRPGSVRLPDLGNVRVAFSRQRLPLPFTLALDAFEMQPYPGSDIPRDYWATMTLDELDDQGRPRGEPDVGIARLNNPLVYRASTGPLFARKFKLSQVGWDPGDRSRPDNQARDDQGRFINQQRYSIIGVGNNVAIRMIFIGSCLVVVGIPWAFYVKPALLQRQKRRLQEQLASQGKLPGRRQTSPDLPAPEPVAT